MFDLILASSSPRRARLLKQIGISFQVEISGLAEPPLRDGNMVEQLALAKAKCVQQRHPGSLILGADTAVVCGNEVFGKPASREEAAAMLTALSGRPHRVLTGVALLRGSTALTAKEETVVFMRSLEQEEIDAYISSGEPMDKAGAYGIQGRGAVFVERIEGCYFNVVGLPLARLALMLRALGLPLWKKGGSFTGQKAED